MPGLRETVRAAWSCGALYAVPVRENQADAERAGRDPQPVAGGETEGDAGTGKPSIGAPLHHAPRFQAVSRRDEGGTGASGRDGHTARHFRRAPQPAVPRQPAEPNVTPYYSDGSVTIYHGEALFIL